MVGGGKGRGADRERKMVSRCNKKEEVVFFHPFLFFFKEKRGGGLSGNKGEWEARGRGE